MIVLNPYLDSLCNSAFKNIGLTPTAGIPKGCFQHPKDAVPYIQFFFEIFVHSNTVLILIHM